MSEWSKEKELKILKRSKWLLTLKILRILAIIGLIYILYMSVIMIFAESSDSKYEDAYFVNYATSIRNPNVYIESSSLHNRDISTFGTQIFSQTLTKHVGLESVVLGEVQVEKKLLTVGSTITYETPGRQHLAEFVFVLPNEAFNAQNYKDEMSPNVWKRLEKLPEGTVAELKLSTKDYMTPEQLLEKLERYDLHVLWMPLFTGEFESFTPGWYGGSANWKAPYDLIGLYGGDSHGDDNFGSRSSITQLNSEMIAESKDMLLSNMEELLTKGASYYENFLGLTNLPERYDYLKSKGFKVYGAVVTGPTKELLKLREETGIHEVQLGDVELWNWEQVE